MVKKYHHGWINSTVTVSRTHPGSDTYPRCKSSRLPRNTLGDRYVLAHHPQLHYNRLQPVRNRSRPAAGFWRRPTRSSARKAKSSAPTRRWAKSAPASSV